MAIQNDGGGRTVTAAKKPKATGSASGSFAQATGSATGNIPAVKPKNFAPAPSAPVTQRATGGLYGGTGMIGGAVSAAGGGGQSDDDYLASGADSAYTAQLAALMKALENYNADAQSQQSKYEVDYGDTVKNLGWMQDDPATPENEGAWNFQDTNTAAGRSFQNQQNDFAGRGLLQSSLYGTANDNLTRSLNDQLGGINTGKQNFMDDLTRQKTAFANDNTLAQQQARAEAIARRAGQIGI